MLITLSFSHPLLFYAMKFSFHSLCHLVMAYELCIFPSASFCTVLSDHFPVTGFPSLLPPPSIDQRKSDKIRPGTLWYVSYSRFSIPPLSRCLFSLELAEWDFMVLYVM
ncbi:hypothetical protein GOODEAATRI_004999 [Goodea atripinnis]|uniref:Uncharacterized protein n=1 Tax=Goodea atripinnis TaxID=208336 RepID=A0ABV0P1J1_9TELE